MKCSIHINRHVLRDNLKHNRSDPAISINTYRGTIKAHEVQMQSCTLIQDTEHPRSCGATIWIETEFDTLVIDGVQANLDMLRTK